MEKVKLSICIPAFNKSKELDQLFKSISSQWNDSIEIIVCEDLSPERNSIIELVNKYQLKYGDSRIKLFLNESNFGYDKNLRNTISKSTGEYVLLCGNDDIINPSSIERIIKKIDQHRPSVIVRSYESFNETEGNEVQIHRYVKEDMLVKHTNPKELAWLFYRSVLVSGLVFNTRLAKKYSTDKVDGFLYYQNYLAVCLFIEGDILYTSDLLVKNRIMGSGFFGTAEVEKNRYTIPGKRTIDSSVNQMRNFFKCAQYSEKVTGHNFLRDLKKVSSAYSLPLLSYHIDKGNLNFINYVLNLRRIGYSGMFFYLYTVSLIILRKKPTFALMQFFKKLFGHTIKIV